MDLSRELSDHFVVIQSFKISMTLNWDFPHHTTATCLIWYMLLITLQQYWQNIAVIWALQSQRYQINTGAYKGMLIMFTSLPHLMMRAIFLDCIFYLPLVQSLLIRFRFSQIAHSFISAVMHTYMHPCTSKSFNKMPWWLWWGMHQIILAPIILQFQMSHLWKLSSLESISMAPHSHYVITTHEFWPISNISQSDLAHSETWAKGSICGWQPQSPVVKAESLPGSQLVGIVPCTCSR